MKKNTILAILMAGILSISMPINATDTTNVERASNKVDKKEYIALIGADPQPWRLNSGDPNSKKNRDPWLEVNKKTSQAMRSHGGVYFYIVNGDLTEFGRSKTYKDYANVYKKNQVPVYEGLGNHDYANNVNDCYENSCAFGAVDRMAREINNNYSRRLVNFSHDMHRNSLTGTISGSLAYSWDFGDIHYAQLQNYPTYHVRFYRASTVVMIGQSLFWLEEDLKKANDRGKASIINFHDGNDHFISGSTDAQKQKFKSLLSKYNVKAVFLGHTHVQSYCRYSDDNLYGDVPIYTAGALFKGDYYLIDVKGKDVSVKAYNGSDGTPRLIKDYGVIGADNSYGCR